MTSINFSYDISGPIIKCHNDSLGLKFIFLWILTIFFSVIFNVFIKIHENIHQCKLISKVETYV